MDITTQAVADTAVLHLKGADGQLLYSGGDPTKPVRIVFYGPGSKAFGVVESRQSHRALKRIQANDGKPSATDPDEVRANSAEDLATITVAFENLTYPPAGTATGEPLYRALYADPTLGFIVRQVDRFVNDWGNFKPGSATA